MTGRGRLRSSINWVMGVGRVFFSPLACSPWHWASNTQRFVVFKSINISQSGIILANRYQGMNSHAQANSAFTGIASRLTWALPRVFGCSFFRSVHPMRNHAHDALIDVQHLNNIHPKMGIDSQSRTNHQDMMLRPYAVCGEVRNWVKLWTVSCINFQIASGSQELEQCVSFNKKSLKQGYVTKLAYPSFHRSILWDSHD